MCGDKDLDLSDGSSDDDTASEDSFRAVRTEKVARKWAYSILICYTLAAVAFITIFIYWLYKKTD